jgi:GNAT superfamily N-acetyltransferase
VPVTDGRGLERFIAFPYDLYRGDPVWVPQLRMDVRTLLSPKKNPFWQHADARYFLAVRDGRTIGRVAAIANRSHNEIHQDKVGFYGFFESIDDQDVADALFEAAAAWLRAKGFDTMRGPMNPSINDDCGLLVDGFDTPPVIMMPHNFRYYVALHERAGLHKAKDLIAWAGGGQGPPERYLKIAQRLAERAGVTLRPLNMKRFYDDVELIKELYNQSWEKNWGFVPLTGPEIDHLAKQLKPIAIPDLVPFAIRDGKVVGFAVALPDFNVALKHNPSGRIWGLPWILWHARHIHRARVPLLGTIPEFRGRGIDALLYHWIWTKAAARGITWGEGGWILEDNAPMVNGAKALGFLPYKTYRVFDKAL